MREGNGKYQKAFTQFGTDGITKKLSRYSGRERETQKSLPAILEREFKAFPLGNIREREFPLMPVVKVVIVVTVIKSDETILFLLKLNLQCSVVVLG